MSLAVDALVVVGGVALGRWVAAAIRARRGRHALRVPAAPPLGRDGDELAGFPFGVGDVVLRPAERDEAWLAGALVFAEEGPVAVLFIAPEAGADRAIWVRDVPGAGIAWLVAIDEGGLALPSEPPPAVEHEGRRFERVGRWPVHVSCVGANVPAVGDRAIVAEYRGMGVERLVVVAGAQRTLGWCGTALGAGEYDVLPGSESTRES